jgi:hypothetical protein
VNAARLDHKVKRVIAAREVNAARLDLKVKEENAARLDLKVKEENVVKQDHKEKLVLRDQKAHQAKMQPYLTSTA